MKEKVSMNKMGTVPVKKLLLSMGLPMIVSMALQAVYNIVDSYFVSCMRGTEEIANMGDYGVNALTLAFPVQMLMVAIGVGTGVGVNALLSKRLGEGDRESASAVAGNSIFIGAMIYLVFLLFGIFGVDAYMHSQTSDPIILEMGTEYLRICTIMSFGICMYITFEKLLQSTGRTTLSTIAQITGALINIILDPILIFGYFGLPEMGISGAALATVIGQCVTAVMDIIFHFHFNKKDIDTSFRYIKPIGRVIREIYKIGIPAIIMQALMSFMTYGVNIIFGVVSTEAVTAYGVYYKIQQFVFFAAFGMNNAMIPVISFNYGRQDKNRVKDGIRYGMIYTLIIMLIGMIGLQLFGDNIVGIFAVADETKSLCVLAIRIITLGYLFVGANIAFQGIFQALGYGISSLVLSLLRLIVVALPLAALFARMDNAADLIWIAFPVAEAVAFVAGCFIMRVISTRTVNKIELQME